MQATKKTKFTPIICRMSFTPTEIAAEITSIFQNLRLYEPDLRQKIADSWPASIDDSARADWDGNINLI
jgi:hypothetical protein